MRSLGILALVATAACGTDDVNRGPDYAFGPIDVAANTEISDQCVSIDLNNDTELYINKVELKTGPGFHHSNWFWVPDPPDGTGLYHGPDGVWTCADRKFDQIAAAYKGGVIFAQSTQSQHDIQQFPAGAAVKVPPHAQLVSTIHLLNASDTPLHLTPVISLTGIPKETVTTELAGVSFENHALGLPPNKRSRFTVDCDLQPMWDNLYALGNLPTPAPSFKLYYALAHYHALGTGMEIDALAPDDTTAANVYTTASAIGDELGGTLDPPFDFSGYSRLRFSCDYYNNTTATVGWGIGNQEMCVFLAFSDSAYAWAGGVVTDDPPGDPVDDNGVMSFSHKCTVFATESATH
jgi:hypothetical protein